MVSTLTDKNHAFYIDLYAVYRYAVVFSSQRVTKKKTKELLSGLFDIETGRF